MQPASTTKDNRPGLIASRVDRVMATATVTTLAVAFWLGLQRPHNVAAQTSTTQSTIVDWPAYNGQVNGDHYSPLSQINLANVKQLKVAWTFDIDETGTLQTNPLIIGRTLYAVTPKQKVVALNAATGHELWRFDPGTAGGQPTRGFAYWTDGKSSILFAGALHNLFALDPATGKLIPGFGNDGKLDLRIGLKDGLPNTDTSKDFLALTTPGIVYKDMVIVGFRAPETEPALHGDIRAFDVHTGKLRWTFHTIPHPGEYGYNTWPTDGWKTSGSANNWAGMALDAARGIVYVPTGSAVSDFYGDDRIGDDLFANSLIALDASTGKRLWHFQAIHHDVWDRDFPAPPALVTIHRDGKAIDAVAQTSKLGYVYLFDRITGKPLFPIVERPFPASDVPGEKTAATQPIPLAPEPYARQRLTADMLTNRTPEAHAWAVEAFKEFRSDGQFIPMTLDKQTVVFPGFDGGAEWGGPAIDPRTGVIYVNSNDIAWTGGLSESKAVSPGATVYQNQCSLCHGPDRKGNPPQFPNLVDINKRLTDAEITTVLHTGKGRMPAFPGIEGARLEALLDYLKTGNDIAAPASARTDEAMKKEPGSDSPEAKYSFTGYRRFSDPDGYPAIVPPWGTLNAIDLNTGKYLWKIPLGEYPELVAQGIKNTGSETYGGPVLTASGLLIIASTTFDHKIRAFAARTGELLWEADLPYAGNATPATYMIDGKQYVVIATSNARNRKAPQGSAYVAFALP